MFSLAQLRRLGPLLLGLILLAQTAGVVSLISMHIQHAFENEQDVAADLAESGTIKHAHHHHAHHDGGQHEHDTSDPNDQCCTLHHHLAGVLPVADMPSRSDLIASIIAIPLRSSLGTDPGAVERPPKLQLSI